MKIDRTFKESNLREVEHFGEVFEEEFIVCPHCGVQWESEYADVEDAPFRNEEYQCIECDKWFLVDCEPIEAFGFTSRKYEEE